MHLPIHPALRVLHTLPSWRFIGDRQAFHAKVLGSSSASNPHARSVGNVGTCEAQMLRHPRRAWPT